MGRLYSKVGRGEEMNKEKPQECEIGCDCTRHKKENPCKSCQELKLQVQKLYNRLAIIKAQADPNLT